MSEGEKMSYQEITNSKGTKKFVYDSRELSEPNENTAEFEQALNNYHSKKAKEHVRKANFLRMIMLLLIIAAVAAFVFVFKKI